MNKMSKIVISDGIIKGVKIVSFPAYKDERKSFTKLLRAKRLPEIKWSHQIQIKKFDNARGWLNDPHYHKKQIECCYLDSGEISVFLYDLRPKSPTFKKGTILEMNRVNKERDPNAIGLVIPRKVAHRFLVKSERAILICTVDKSDDHDNLDEYKLVWNDPAIGLDWGIEIQSFLKGI